MTAKHTKGPWKILPEEYNRDYIRIRGTVLGGRYKIANVCGTLGEDGALAKEMRANAALIAAAPELYECLMHLQNRDWFRDGVTGEVTCILNADKVRAAIQKATSIGEQ